MRRGAYNPAAMSARDLPRLEPRLRWGSLYREAELLKAALRIYTKPLFSWRKALQRSTDGGTLYDFARTGLRRLDGLHAGLARGVHAFRPMQALTFNFNGKHRTLYIAPWEDRVVDLLLYRLLTRRLHAWLSPHAWAYRATGFGVDRCQREIGRAFRSGEPRYVVKRDIARYFDSVNHDRLRAQLETLVEPGDPLAGLLDARIRFRYVLDGVAHDAVRGIPFGTAIACAFANVHLTGLDREIAAVPGVGYFRYADDLLAVARTPEAAREAARRMDDGIAALALADKPAHRLAVRLAVAPAPAPEADFAPAAKLRHLGLEFRADGSVGLSRDKFRKLTNLFRYGFRRQKRRMARLTTVEGRARLAITLANRVLDSAIRNVAIIDYYLKHVTDEVQIALLDRWLAEEVLALATRRGHKKSNFRVVPYETLRAWGLPSLVHRRRLLRHGHLESTFFVWKVRQAERARDARDGAGTREGTAARPEGAPFGVMPEAFSPSPEAAAAVRPVGEGAACGRVSWKTSPATRDWSLAQPSLPSSPEVI